MHNIIPDKYTEQNGVKQIFEQYTDPIPDYLGRYIDDCVGTASCSRGELECFINNFHPALQFTWEICISCSRCGMLYIGETGRCLRTRFGEHRRAVTSNDANQPVARHFNNGSHCVSDMEIRVLCPISGSNDSRKRHEMRLISKLGTVHPLGINERFSYI